MHCSPIGGTALGRGWVGAILDTGNMPGNATAALGEFQARRGDASPWRVAGTLLLCLFAGVAAAFAAHRLTRGPEMRLYSVHPASLWSQIGIITARFVLQGVQLLAFVAAAFVIDAIVNRTVPADSTVVRYVVRSIGWTWFAVMAARFVLSPTRPNLRLCSVDDRTAWFLTRRIGLIFGWSAFSVGLFALTWEFGWPGGGGALGFWLSVIFHGLMALTLWQGRARHHPDRARPG